MDQNGWEQTWPASRREFAEAQESILWLGDGTVSRIIVYAHDRVGPSVYR
jgi:hypothetical protein